MDMPKGTLRYLTAQTVRVAVASVRSGDVYSLNLPIDYLDPPPFGRAAPSRSMRQHNSLVPLEGGRYGILNDDYLTLPLQGSSHWDSLAHFGVISPHEPGVFFGGAGLDETMPQPFAKSLGIDAFASGIVARGILLDMVDTLCGPEAQYLPDDVRISVSDLERCLDRHDITLGQGDGVLVYTGFERRLAACSPETWVRLEEANAGLDSSTMPFWEAHEVAFLASDNLAVEASPYDFGLHEGALCRLGLPLGEMWALDALARACRKDGHFDFLVTAAPLNVRGAFGSPANALAIR